MTTQTTPTETLNLCENCGASAHEGGTCAFCYWLQDQGNRAALGQLLRATYRHAQEKQVVLATDTTGTHPGQEF